MTEHGAIRKLKCEQERNNTPSVDIAYCMAIEALEKQIPKRANLSGDGYSDGHLVYDTYECPRCGKEYELEYEEYEYCPNCGQCILIELSEREDEAE